MHVVRLTTDPSITDNGLADSRTCRFSAGRGQMTVGYSMKRTDEKFTYPSLSGQGTLRLPYA